MNTSESKFMPLPLWIYIIMWGFFVYLFISLLSFKAEDPNNIILTGMYFVDFGVHEASHIVMAWAPPVITAASGSIGEVTFTILLLVAALKGKAYFAAVFTGLWVMLGFMSAGRYMTDARTQALPLIGPGETVQHDWNFVFSQLGWLDADTAIGGTVIGIGVLIGVASLLFGLYLLFLKFVRGRASAA